MGTDDPATNRAAQPQPASDYPELFRNFILYSAEAILATLADTAASNWEEVRDRSLHILNYALKLTQAWPVTRDLLLRLSPKMEQAGHRDDWIEFLERGVSQSQQLQDRPAEAELGLSIGELLRLRSKFALARQWLNASIATFADLGDDRGQARARNELAFVAWQQHHYDEVDALAQTALTLLDGDDPERATCFSRLGLAAIDRQQWAVAERYHRAALAIRQAQGDQRKIAWSLQNLGYALQGQERYAEAIDCYEQAIAILLTMHDSANYAIAQMNLGAVYWLIGQPMKALEAYTLAERIYHQLQDTHYLAKIYNNKGLAYRDLPDLIQAEQSFITSITLYEALNDFSFRLEALDELGLVYLAQGQYDKAHTIFESVLAALPQVAGTPTYTYLTQVLPDHLAKAKEAKSA